MTDRDLMELVLKKITAMESTMASKDELAEIKTTMATKDDLAEIKATMATKDDIARLERLINGTMEIVEATYREVEQNTAAISILAGRLLRQEADMQILKKAR